MRHLGMEHSIGSFMCMSVRRTEESMMQITLPLHLRPPPVWRA